MPKRSVFDDDELAFLGSKIDSFIDARATRRKSEFFADLYTAFFEKWPTTLPPEWEPVEVPVPGSEGSAVVDPQAVGAMASAEGGKKVAVKAPLTPEEQRAAALVAARAEREKVKFSVLVPRNIVYLPRRIVIFAANRWLVRQPYGFSREGDRQSGERYSRGDCVSARGGQG